MNRLTLLVGTSLILLAAGCDSSSTPPATVTPTPSPAPTASPTSTPSPTPSPSPVAATSFPLQGRTTFSAGTYLAANDGGFGNGIILPVNPPAFEIGFGSDRSLEVDLLTGLAEEAKWHLRIYRPAAITTAIQDYYFRPARATPPGSRDVVAIGADNSGQTLTVLNNLFPGEVTNEAAFQLQYTGFAYHFKWGTNTGSHPWAYDYLTFGYPTSTGAAPTTGTHSYNAGARATVLTNNSNSSTASEQTAESLFGLNVDYAARTVSFTMILSFDHPTASACAGPVTTVTFTGTGTINVLQQIEGTITSADTTYAGSFKGLFHGPAGQEIGLLFGMDWDGACKPSATSALNFTVHQRFIGAIVGK
jgi:hypothetical protein